MAADWTTEHLQGVNENRVLSVVSSATPSVDADVYSSLNISALAVAVTSFTVTGEPQHLQELTFRILDNGIARALAFGAQFEAVGAALPVTTVAGKRHTLKFVYDSVTTKWGLVFAAVEA